MTHEMKCPSCGALAPIGTIEVVLKDGEIKGVLIPLAPHDDHGSVLAIPAVLHNKGVA